MSAGELPELLLVDDDPLITDALHYVLSDSFEVRVATDRPGAHGLLRQLGRVPPLALIDLGLPPTPHRPDEGFRLIGELIAAAPDIKVLVLSGQSDEAHARHARALGAIDFIAKPCEPQRLLCLLRVALEQQAAERGASGPADAIVGNSPATNKLRQQIAQYAAAPFPVLIEGESGSGKELVAQSLHARSPRGARPLLALNCAAIAATLVEPTLFGHARGSFTGATGARAGYFEEAGDSTLFLDEIGELHPELQAKLLRVLEDGTYQRVGETQSRRSNARIIAATNRDLRQDVRAGRFRADLYHRLSVFTIGVPPLRELGEDRIGLFEHYAQVYARLGAVAPVRLDPVARALWLEYGFPGNVRELRNIVIRLTTKHAGGEVGAEALAAELDLEYVEHPSGALPSEHRARVETARRHLQAARDFDLDATLRDWERSYVDAALALAQGNLSRAARMLGVNRTTLYGRIQSHETSAARERP